MTRLVAEAHSKGGPTVATRRIGPAGTAARLLIGLLIVVLALALDTPSRGISWWDVVAVVIALPLLTAGVTVVVDAVYRRNLPATATRARIPWSLAQIGAAAIIIAMVIAVGTALTFVTPIDRVAIFLFFGLSMVLAALRGYDGCEILALPNTILRRRDAIWCPLYTPIDSAERPRPTKGSPVS